jgi:hypothetical protein
MKQSKKKGVLNSFMQLQRMQILKRWKKLKVREGSGHKKQPKVTARLNSTYAGRARVTFSKRTNFSNTIRSEMYSYDSRSSTNKVIPTEKHFSIREAEKFKRDSIEKTNLLSVSCKRARS